MNERAERTVIVGCCGQMTMMLATGRLLRVAACRNVERRRMFGERAKVDVPERERELERKRKQRQTRTPSRTPDPAHLRYAALYGRRQACRQHTLVTL